MRYLLLMASVQLIAGLYIAYRLREQDHVETKSLQKRQSKSNTYCN